MDSNGKIETREEYLQKRRDAYLESQERSGQLTEEERQELEARKAIFQLLEQAIGSYCEIKTMNNRLIVLGQLKEAEDLMISVVSADESLMPPVLFNSEVKLVIRPPKQPPLVIRANVCGSSGELWRLDRFERFHYKESRSYFRQPVSKEATVCKAQAPMASEEELPEAAFSDVPQELPVCTVLDVSLEGLRFRSAEVFERGDWVNVSNLLLTAEDKYPFALTGQICWADKISRTEFMFGCRFAPMSESEQDALCSSIFTLQRQELQARRLGRRP